MEMQVHVAASRAISAAGAASDHVFIPALRSVGRTISAGVRALRILSDPKLLGSDQPPAAAGKDHPPAAAGTVPPPDSAATIIASSQAELPTEAPIESAPALPNNPVTPKRLLSRV